MQRPQETLIDIVIEEPPPKIVPPELPKPDIKIVVKTKVAPPPVIKTVAVAPTPLVEVRTPAPPAPAEPIVTPAPAPPIVSPIAPPIVQAPAPPPPPPPPQRNDEAAAREAEFTARVRAAIQAAVVYPPAARNMGQAGRARVEFHLRDGVTSQIRIIQSSGTNLLDRAAMAAVSSASYPEAPDTLKGKDRPYQVSVVFDLNAAR